MMMESAVLHRLQGLFLDTLQDTVSVVNEVRKGQSHVND